MMLRIVFVTIFSLYALVWAATLYADPRMYRGCGAAMDVAMNLRAMNYERVETIIRENEVDSSAPALAFTLWINEGMHPKSGLIYVRVANATCRVAVVHDWTVFTLPKFVDFHIYELSRLLNLNAIKGKGVEL